MKIFKLNLSKMLQIILFVFLMLVISNQVSFAATPQPTNSSIQFNIAKEAYDQQLPTANSFNPSSNAFKQLFANLIGSILSVVITIGVLMLLLYLVWGAFSWITSGGDKGKVEEARNRMTTAVIGIIVLSSSIAIFMLVQQILGICVLDFWGTACRTPAVPGP